MEKTKKHGKKRQAGTSDINNDEDESLSSDSDTESETELDGVENIDIEFEAQSPVETDFHGIKQLLDRLFLTQRVDLSELANLIISQTNVGSTIKVVIDDDDDDENDEVYGISSLLSLKKHKEKHCVEELKNGIMSKCKSVEADKCETLRNILEKKNVGFLVNERFINIPPQFAVPLHKTLRAEVEEVALEDSDFKFDYLLVISKTLQATEQPGNVENKKIKRKRKDEMDEMKIEELEYTNVEDKIFHKACDFCFSYSVTEATGFAIGGG